MNKSEITLWLGFIGVCTIPGLIVWLFSHSLLSGIIAFVFCLLIGIGCSILVAEMFSGFINIFLTLLGLNKNGK